MSEDMPRVLEVVNLLGPSQTDVAGRTTQAAALLLAVAIQQGQLLDLNPQDMALALAAAQLMVSGNFGVCTCDKCAPLLTGEADMIAAGLRINDVVPQ